MTYDPLHSPAEGDAFASHERVRRPELERSAPIRDFGAFLTGARGDGASDAREALNAALRAGYDIADRAIQSGRAVQGAAGSALRAVSPDSEMTQLVSAWFELVAGMARPFLRVALPAQERATPAVAAAPASRATRFVVDIKASCTVSLTLELQRPAARLVTHGLHAAPPAVPLTHIELVAEGDEPLRVRLVVPVDQPPGLYHGVVCDADSGAPCGMVSARLSA